MVTIYSLYCLYFKPLNSANLSILAQINSIVLSIILTYNIYIFWYLILRVPLRCCSAGRTWQTE